MGVRHDNPVKPRRIAFGLTTIIQLVALSCLLEIIECAIGLLGRKTFVCNPGLSIADRLALGLAGASAWLAVLSATCILVNMTLEALPTGGGVWKRRVMLTSCAGVVTGAVLYPLVGWIFLLRSGTFPIPDTFLFAASNSRMLWYYFWECERAGVVLLLLGVLTIFGAGLWSVRRLAARRERSPSGSTPFFVQHMIAICIALNGLLIPLPHASATEVARVRVHRVEASTHPWPSFGFELRFRTSPFVTAFADAVLPGKDDPLTQDDIPAKALRPICSLPARPPTPNAVQRAMPSVVMVVVESLRSDVVLARHQGREITPWINELARGGVVFTDCHTPSTHSDYADPAIHAALDPLRSTQHYYYSTADPWPRTLMFDVVKPLDYATAIGSSQNEAWGNMHLFYDSPNLDVLLDSRNYSGATRTNEATYRTWASRINSAGKVDDADTMQRSINWIGEQVEAGQRFCISINLQTSHFPYLCTFGECPFQPGEIDFQATLTSYPLDKTDVVRNAYFNALQYADEQIGVLLQYLAQAGLRDDVLIVVTGDHGEAFHENGICGHAGFPADPVTRVALVLNRTGHILPREDSSLCSTLDIVPTVLGQLGLEPFPAFQGYDLLSDARPADAERFVFVHCQTALADASAVLHESGWKYVHDYKLEMGQLYFLPNDPHEERDLRREHSDVGDTLSRVLQEWRTWQLSYHAQPRYHNWCFPPRPRLATTAERELLAAPAEQTR